MPAILKFIFVLVFCIPVALFVGFIRFVHQTVQQEERHCKLADELEDWFIHF